MSRTSPVNVWMEISRAQSEAMDKLLRGWDEEIQRSFEALREQQAAINQQKIAEHVDAMRDYYRDQSAEIDAHASAESLETAAIAAAASDNPIAIPSGLRVGSSLVCAPVLAEIAALSEAAQVESLDRDSNPTQASLLFCLGHGFLPHPGDVGDLMQTLGISSHLKEEFLALGAALDKLDGRTEKVPGLKVQAANDRLQIVKNTLEGLHALGPKNVLALAATPEVLRGQTIATDKSSVTSTPAKTLDRVLDALAFGSKSSKS